MTKLLGFQDANYGTLKTLNLGILFVLDVINIALSHLFILFMVSQCTYKIYWQQYYRLCATQTVSKRGLQNKYTIIFSVFNSCKQFEV